MNKKSLRSILGGSNRVKKRPSDTNRTSRARSSSSTWSDALPRTKSTTSTPATPTKLSSQDTTNNNDDDNDQESEWGGYDPSAPLPDHGLAHTLATDLTLRDIPQAMRYSTTNMFTPMPANPSSWGLHSTRVSALLNHRASLPPLTTVAHLHALLRSPTAVEREADELIRGGAVRKIVIWRRDKGSATGGGVVEFLIESAKLESLVRDSASLREATKDAFVAWLRAHPAQLKMRAAGELAQRQVDELVRAGFLTTYHDFDLGQVSTGFAQPEDRGSGISLQSVARAAAGSVDAVGGSEGVHGSGGSGGRSGGMGERGQEVSLAVPGQGTYLKLVSEAVGHLGEIVGKASAFKEMPEGVLRERWDGSGVVGRHVGRGFGLLPGKTRKWKTFWGVGFEWVLCEAVGMGTMEVFETGSVGRGVRLL